MAVLVLGLLAKVRLDPASDLAWSEALPKLQANGALQRAWRVRTRTSEGARHKLGQAAGVFIMHARFNQATFAAEHADDLDSDHADSTHPHAPELRDSFGNTATDLRSRLTHRHTSLADSGACSVDSTSNRGTCKGPQHVGCCYEFMLLVKQAMHQRLQANELRAKPP